MPSKEKASRGKICMVPVCRSVKADVPDRIFFVVPDNRKKDWLEKVGCDISSIKPNKRLYCCENHFDVKRDIEGYDFYKHFGGRIKLIESAFPSKCLGENNRFENVDEVLGSDSVDPLSLPDLPHENRNESNSDIDASIDSKQACTKLNATQNGRTEKSTVTFVHNDDEASLSISTADDSNANPTMKTFQSTSNNTKHECGKCKKMLSSSKSLKRHLRSVHAGNEDEYFPCEDWQQTFTTRKGYKKHKLTHTLEQYDCPKCGESLSSSTSFKRHIQSCHTGEEDSSSNRMDETKSDVDNNGTEFSWRCQCGDVFVTRDDYLNHKINHKKTFQCDVCAKIFRTRLHLKVHFPSHMKVKPFLCEICSCSFARANNFRRHKLTHVIDKRFVCEECGKCYPANYLLKQHKSLYHNELKPRRMRKKAATDCDDCGITLNSPYRLKLHRLKLHDPENAFQCHTCQQTFTTEVLMNHHVMRMHSPEYEYVFKCYICTKKYNQEAALKRHVKLHTDPKKPVTCELCGKTLGRPNRLKPHMRALHNPSNPFKCSICRQTFREQKILDNHVTQLHEQSIICQYCLKSYSNQRGLQQHIRKFHVNSSLSTIESNE